MYQALYRKYRPRTFDDVVGQAHITETLKQQVVNDRLSHAYLFIGTRGTGKTTCARILAKAVNCENPQNGNPCNACRFCRGVDDGSLMDVVELDAASNNGVDNVRQLRDEAVFSPASARRRVYIIDEVHMLSGPAFNALLKILEEPPEHLMFILATTELQKVPATILSRCQRHAFKRLDTEAIVGRLNHVAGLEHLALTPDAAELIAGLSEGGMRDALSMLDQCSGREKIDVDTVYSALGLAGNRDVARLLRHIADRDGGAAVELFSRLWQNGKDPATLLGELSTLLRDLLMRAVAPKGGRALLSGGYDEAMLDSFRGLFSTPTLIAQIGCIQSALADMRAGQARTVCELCLLTLCEPGLSDTLPMLRARVAELEAKLKNGVPVVPTAAPTAAPVSTQKPAAAAPSPGPQAAPKPVPAPRPAPETEASLPDDRDAPPLPDDRDAPPFDPDPVRPAPANEERFPSFEPPMPPEEAAQPTPLPAAAPPAAAPSGDGALWEQLRERVSGQFPIGIYAILSDPAQVSGSLSGDTLRLSVANAFALNMLDRPDVTAKLGAAATELAGRPLRVAFGEQSAESAPAAEPDRSRLDELSKYPIVKFK